MAAKLLKSRSRDKFRVEGGFRCSGPGGLSQWQQAFPKCL